MTVDNFAGLEVARTSGDYQTSVSEPQLGTEHPFTQTLHEVCEAILWRQVQCDGAPLEILTNGNRCASEALLTAEGENRASEESVKSWIRPKWTNRAFLATHRLSLIPSFDEG